MKKEDAKLVARLCEKVEKRHDTSNSDVTREKRESRGPSRDKPVDALTLITP